MEYDVDQRRRALAAFLTAHKSHLSARKLSIAGGLSNSAVAQFTGGNVRSLTDETYERLAWAASELLGRVVTAAELRGDLAPVILMGVDFFVGPGAQLFPAGQQEKNRRVPTPPGLAAARAAIVRDEFGLPLFEAGDVLYFGEANRDIATHVGGKAALVETDDGRQIIRRVMPGKGRRFSLLGLHAGATPEEATLSTASRICWVMCS